MDASNEIEKIYKQYPGLLDQYLNPDYAEPPAKVNSNAKKRPWTVSETNDLVNGVNKYGLGRWALIVKDGNYHFNERTNKDLKDKWRTITKSKSRSQIQKRKFILLDQFHQPLLTVNGSIRTFNNKWPREAALKVASRSEFYRFKTANSNEYITIYLAKFEDYLNARDPQNSPKGSFVYVYRGTRYKRNLSEFNFAKRLCKFDDLKRKYFWCPSVEKICHEKINKNQV